MGLRELKKAQTRKRISDLATALFIERGYSNVTTAEIAKEAEVSLKTLFNYFPKKESLVFDIEDAIDAEMVEAIRSRDKRVHLLDSLHDYFLTSTLFDAGNQDSYAEFMKLVRSSPELTDYYRGMLHRYEGTLSKEIRKETGVSKMEADGVARLILEGVNFAWNSSSRKEVLKLVFKLLKKGWNP